MPGATRRSSSEKHYQEPDIESLKSWRWYRKLSLFFNLEKNELDSYLLDITPIFFQQGSPETRTISMPWFKVKNDYFLKKNLDPFLLRGKRSIIKFQVGNRLVFVKNKPSNKLAQVLIVYPMSAILMELNWLQDYELNEAICVKKN